jgi:hypothetical protein
MGVMTEINGKKLKEVLTEDGHNLVDYDRQIGYRDGFFNTCLGRGRINQVAYKFLTNVLNDKNLNIQEFTVNKATLDEPKRVDIDVNIINDYLKQHKMTKAEMSRGIGRGRSHISNIMCGDGTIAKCDYVAIKSIYGIDVAKKEPTKPRAHKIHVKDNRSVSELTADELSRLIYKSVYSATIKANEMLNK